jgi:ABC-type transporter Mla maintaining outer membrane lipid asymmetry permease subunit MlaE
LRLEEVGRAANRAVGKCVIAIVLVDAFFIIIYLVI